MDNTWSSAKKRFSWLYINPLLIFDIIAGKNIGLYLALFSLFSLELGISFANLQAFREIP